jgi:phospholipid/cholesterol/gamma-HCH transport system substrate-binding protein
MSPTASARRLPLTRVTILAQVLLAVIVGGSLLAATGVRLPGGAQPYALQVVLPDAAGLDEHDRPQVAVAGVHSGTVSSVRFSTARGEAVIRVALDPDVRGRLFADASVRLTPRSALNDLVLDIDPGDPAAGPLRGDLVRGDGRSAPTGPDRVFGIFDDDTRAYAQLLVGTLREVTAGRPGPLRAAIRALPAVATSATGLAERVAQRRVQLRRLVGELDQIAAATGSRGAQLTRAIGSARRTLRVTAARRNALAGGVRELPATLAQLGTTFAGLQRTGQALDPALIALRPAARALPGGLRAVRALLPSLRSAVADTGALARDGRRPVRELDTTLTQIGAAARTLRPAVPAIATLVDAVRDGQPLIRRMLAFWPGTLSATDALGVTTRAIFFRVLPVDPRAFGLPAAGTTGTQGARLRTAATRLRRARPELFAKVGGAAAASLPVQVAQALLTDLCRRGHDFACQLVVLVAAHPPRLVRR